MESGKVYGGEVEEGECSGMGGKSRSSLEWNGGVGGGEVRGGGVWVECGVEGCMRLGGEDWGCGVVMCGV